MGDTSPRRYVLAVFLFFDSLTFSPTADREALTRRTLVGAKFPDALFISLFGQNGEFYFRVFRFS